MKVQPRRGDDGLTPVERHVATKPTAERRTAKRTHEGEEPLTGQAILTVRSEPDERNAELEFGIC